MKKIASLSCRSLWFFVFFTMICGKSFAQEDFPYHLVVAKETADILSGPGKTHYATDRLPKGTKVQIFRHDPGGYYAIRPPAGSFSLVLASAVQQTADPGVIEVTASAAKAWVGSRLPGNFKPMWQLKLKPGELLTVIKKVEIPGAYSDESESWYQVNPPRGEFRWIHKDNLGSQAPRTISSADVTNQQIQQSSIEVELLQQLAGSRAATSPRGGWTVLQEGAPRSNVSANEAAFDAQPGSGAPTFAHRLAALDLALSQMVVGSKSSWNLAPLKASADRLRKEATTGDELAQANALARKVIDFQKIQASDTGLESRIASRSAQLLTPNLTSSQSNNTGNRQVQYDGEGVLRKLYVNGGVGRSIYALEDKQGKLIKTISASSGVNLERFIGKPVGLFGKSGYNQRLNRPHLTAQRVVDLVKIR